MEVYQIAVPFGVLAIIMIWAILHGDRKHIGKTDELLAHGKTVATHESKISHCEVDLIKIRKDVSDLWRTVNGSTSDIKNLSDNMRFKSDELAKFLKSSQTEFDILKQRIKDLEPAGPLQVELMFSEKVSPVKVAGSKKRLAR